MRYMYTIEHSTPTKKDMITFAIGIFILCLLNLRVHLRNYGMERRKK